jgi:predicted NAD-dependent protein-ADP-ribosyltransferase YbiA (DUF1768 family)
MLRSPTCDGKEHLPLHSFAVCRIFLDGHVWASVEQYYQAAKFADTAYQDIIRLVEVRRNTGARMCAGLHGREVQHLGQSTDHARVDDFRGLEVLYIANCAKFEQNPSFRQKLLQTYGPIEAPMELTDEWQPWQARVLERIREELRPPAERDSARLQQLHDDFARSGAFDEPRAEELVEAARRAFGADLRHVVVNLITGEKLDCYLLPHDFISTLKETIALQLGISDTRVKLLLTADVLEDAKTLEDSNVGDGSCLTAIVASPVPHNVQVRNGLLHDMLATAGRLQ